MKKCLIAIFLLSFLAVSGCATTKSEEAEKAKKNIKVAEIDIELGIAYLNKGDIERSKQKFLFAQQKAPQLPEVWYSTAYFFEKTGNKDLAKANYIKAVELAPKRGDVLNNYGTFLCRNGKYAESIHYFLDATKDQQYLDTASAYENAGFCALKIPDKTQAITYFNLALQTDPTRLTSMNELNKLKPA